LSNFLEVSAKFFSSRAFQEEKNFKSLFITERRC